MRLNSTVLLLGTIHIPMRGLTQIQNGIILPSDDHFPVLGETKTFSYLLKYGRVKVIIMTCFSCVQTKRAI